MRQHCGHRAVSSFEICILLWAYTAFFEDIGAPDFLLDFCGPTSRGKTTALVIAASSWGCPDQRCENSLVPTWDSTAAFRERLSSLLANLPVFIDEGSLRDHDPDAIKMAYAIASGRGRGRGRGRGIGHTGTWATVAMTSGESPIISSSKLGGLKARVFTVWGSPFGRTSGEVAGIARRLKTVLHENFGFAGPAMVHYVLDNCDQWDEWRRVYRDYLRRYEERAGDDPVVCRMAEPLAAIAITAQIAHSAMRLPWPFSDPILPLWDVLTAEAADAEQSVGALEHALDYARGRHDPSSAGAGQMKANPSGVGPDAGTPMVTTSGSGWSGSRRSLSLAVSTSRRRFAAWGERGWLLRDNSSGKLRIRVRIGDELAWIVAITQEAIRAVDGDTNAADGPPNEVRLAEVG